MNGVAEVFNKTSEVFDSMNDYIDNLPSSRNGLKYKNSELIVKGNISDKYKLLEMVIGNNLVYEKNKSNHLIEMSEIIVYCMSFHRENKHLSRKDYAEKIENYPTHLRWLMMQFYINTDIDFVHYFKHIYKVKFIEHRVSCISKTKDGVYDSIENNRTPDIVINLIDDNLEFFEVYGHLPRKEYALMSKNDDDTKTGLRMRVYDNREPDYVRYINKHYYVFDRILPIMQLTLNKK